jgi:1,4-alpha-glucan branching enzyme
MGWMHDTLEYITREPVHRKYHHNELSFRMVYAYNENFALPLSHDEVVHGKASLLSKMPGDDWQKFANLRLLLGLMYAQAGKKLLFMGSEFGQWTEWNHDSSLDWQAAEHPPHQGMMKWVQDLNRLYKSTPALYEKDFDPSGFQWICGDDSQNSALSFLRRGRHDDKEVVIVCNFTPVPREGYRVGVPREGFWKVLLNSDAGVYWGSEMSGVDGGEATAVPMHGQPQSVELVLPPLGVVFLGSA